MCRRAHQAVTDRDAYNVMRDHGLLHKPRVHVANLGCAGCGEFHPKIGSLQQNFAGFW
jgi:hypothetical protein